MRAAALAGLPTAEVFYEPRTEAPPRNGGSWPVIAMFSAINAYWGSTPPISAASIAAERLAWTPDLPHASTHATPALGGPSD